MSTEAAVTPKPSIAEQFLAEFKAEPAPVAAVEPAAVETAPAADAATVEAVPAVEPAKTEKEQAEPSLARRLATLAAAEKRSKAEAEARAAKDAEDAPFLERMTKAKAAKSRAEAARLALELDDEGEADLFLELHKKFEGADKPKDPEAELERKLEAKLEAKLKERDNKRAATEAAQLESMRGAHVADVTATLEVSGDDFPLVAIAPPSAVDITAISEAWLVANGEIPKPEEVLKLFQDQRQSALNERTKSAEAKKGKNTAPAAKTGEASGTKAKPVRTNEVPITTPRKLTVQEQFLQEYKAATGA